MIINTGQRTDIPAWYSDWFAGRLREGFVCVRKPYNLSQVNKYILNPDVVDVIGFCSKNPEPMFKYMGLLKDYGQYWSVIISPFVLPEYLNCLALITHYNPAVHNSTYAL